MTIRTWTLSTCVLILVAWQAQRTSTGQERSALPSSPPAVNPIDPAALNAAPAFGDSGPVSKLPNVSAQESSDTASTTWIPKLRVVLVTSMSDKAVALVHRLETIEDRGVFPSDVSRPAVQKTTRTIDVPSRSSVILTCDDVSVEVISSENDKLTYSFSCKGKAVLSMNGCTVSGDSISASEGTLTITNAVVKSDQATMSSEKMILRLPILAVEVGAANAHDFLKPTADPIGAGDRFESPRSFGKPDRPSDRNSAPAEAKPDSVPDLFPADV